MKRLSMLSGQEVEAKQSAKAPDAQQVIADLRVELATASAERDAARAEAEDLRLRLAAAEQALLAERAKPVPQMPEIPAPQVIVQRGAPPAYEVTVTGHTADGRIATLSIKPK